MTDIKRYTFETCQCGCEAIERHETKNGPYVSYEDHADVVSTLKFLVAEKEFLKKYWKEKYQAERLSDEALDDILDLFTKSGL